MFYCVNVLWLIYSFLVGEYLGIFHCGTIINSTAMNILEYVFWWTYVCISVGSIPRIEFDASEDTHVMSSNI